MTEPIPAAGNIPATTSAEETEHLPPLLAELDWRGMMYQATEGAGGALSGGPVVGYCGFDPTAPSLHVGSLVPIMGLVHLQRHGHRPIALVGGGTGMIGDPSGKTAERVLQSAAQVEQHGRAIRAQLERFLDFEGPSGAQLRDNSEWLAPMTAIQLLRDVGKHFTVNYMLAKESVQSRIEGGISYTELSYMLLQAYDFLELHRRDGVTFQLGGSDQWGNITAGIELIRRTLSREAHGITLPLVTTAKGTKFGKSEAGTVWLDARMTSPYKFYQFWMGVDDRDVGRYLRYFTLLSREEIEALDHAVATVPNKRQAAAALARDVTTRVHGADATRVAEETSGVLFGKKDPHTLSPSALEMLMREVPSAEVALAEVPSILELFVASGLAKSKGDARRLTDQGGTYVNGSRVSTMTVVAELERLAGEYLVLRKGAREYAIVRVTG